ncbi:MAG TPA: phosphoribosylamine--glycine ligase [Steroidobacteraceae bacterium]|nr:phosphoribosylamine--glycine ligase [Steroidobacteraceae bacterium]
MKILIVGNAGREHALAWACAAAASVSEVLVAPGNAGTAGEPRVRNAPVAANDTPGLIALARAEQIDLTIIGPETPLVMGVVDEFSAAGLRCFGPTRAAAQLEGSKAYTKEFLRRHGIPTAAYRSFTREDFDAAWLRAQRLPIVIKASGLAAGKGVVIATDADEALSTVQQLFAGRFGSAGDTVVVEEFLEGEEASFIVMADGAHALPFASSQDHKRIGDGDTGANTGGMGAYSPAAVVSPAVHARVMREVIEPTLRGLARDGTPYTGFLYAGLMIDASGAPRVIEYNCRFGDPEAQAVLARLRSDLPVLCLAALEGRLARQRIEFDERAALGVVVAAAGYPGAITPGATITGLERAAALPGKIFHAGTERRGERVVTSGGRVLCAVGLGARVAQAQRAAYDLVSCVDFPGAQFRHDIGYRAIAREA